MRDILASWATRRTEPLALATVVRTQGSTYRKAGARLLVSGDGQTTGLVSGGCLEREVAERGLEVLRRGQARLMAYDTRRLLGCNGSLEILLEPLWPEDGFHFLSAAEAHWQNRESLISATLFEGQGVPCHLLGSYAIQGASAFAPDEARWLGPILADEQTALRNGALEHRCYEIQGGSVATLWQRLSPQVRLFIFGGGPDVLPLVILAGHLGWEITVICHPGQDEPELPRGSRLVVWSPDECAEAMRGDDRTAAIIMTHHYGRDLGYLRAMLPKGLAYLGLLGPRHRRERLLGDLADLGGWPTDKELSAFRSPAGLDIGADGPEEIALSILAEIKAVLSGRTGGCLKDRAGAIHCSAEVAPV